MVPKKNDTKSLIDLLNNIPGLNYGKQEVEGKHLDAINILSLPKHLRKSAIAMLKVSKGPVSSISKITGNDENIERTFLEELTEMRYLRKQKTDSEFYYELIVNESPNKLPTRNPQERTNKKRETIKYKK